MVKPGVAAYSQYQYTSTNNVQFYSSPGHYLSTSSSSRSGRLCQGPRKVICFCLLAVIAPSFFVSLVLVMRFVLNGTATYHINPSDMRILDHKISTTWCQKQTIRLNTSFTAYLTDGEPHLIQAPVPLTTTKTLIIPDDHKEYWGFYLLKGSSFRIRTCAKHKGATLLIVRGRSHLHHCAYIGDSDSAGDSDEYSNSNSFEHDAASNFTRPAGKPGGARTTSQEEMATILAKIRAFVKHRPRGHQRLKENLAQWMLLDLANETGSTIPSTRNSEVGLSYTTTPEEDQTSSTTPPHSIRHPRRKLQVLELDQRKPEQEEAKSGPSEGILGNIEHGQIHRRSKRHEPEVRSLTESGENAAFEDEVAQDNGVLSRLHDLRRKLTSNSSSTNDTPSSIWQTETGHHVGILNDTNPFAVIDGSDSESESSFSSSEEAMAKCEGVVASLYLKQAPPDHCGSDEDSGAIPIVFEDVVNNSGYYYFIFGSENEKRDNFIRARFELDKYVYDLPEPVADCVGVHECKVNLTFWSSQKLVVQIPQPPPETEEVWDEVYIAETECEPRVLLYLAFVVIVPLSVILCAFQ